MPPGKKLLLPPPHQHHRRRPRNPTQPINPSPPSLASNPRNDPENQTRSASSSRLSRTHINLLTSKFNCNQNMLITQGVLVKDKPKHAKFHSTTFCSLPCLAPTFTVLEFFIQRFLPKSRKSRPPKAAL
jgi:hypothetical protein